MPDKYIRTLGLLFLLATVYAAEPSNEESSSTEEWDPDLKEFILPASETLIALTGTPRTQKVMRAPPTRDVSETDLYLLGAIEKLAYRLDFMDKRLRRTEDLIYYLMDNAGQRENEGKDPCPRNFTRIGNSCYHFSKNELNWKSSALACKSLGSSLAELETIEENQDIVTFILAKSDYKGNDFWTGGLNPGLLWIWANSARPVSSNSTSSNTSASNIRGTGRCLRLSYNPAIRSYAYLGVECSVKSYFVCEHEDNSTSRALDRIAKSLKEFRNTKPNNNTT